MSTIVTGLVLYLCSKYFKETERDIDGNKNIVNYITSDILNIIVNNYSKLILIYGVVELVGKGTIFDAVTYTILMLVSIIVVYETIKGYFRYVKQ